ncbi:MAG: DUF2520 domain-containing protein [bacterium]
MKDTVAIIGPGRVGGAIGFILKNRGYPISGIAGRNFAHTSDAASFIGCQAFETIREAALGAGLIFITTPDGIIGEVARRLAESGALSGPVTLIHCSGVLPADVMSAARKSGARLLSLHPLQTFASRESAITNFSGTYFGVEGDEEAVPLGFSLAEELGGTPFIIPSESKPLYHAAACVASNYLVALISSAIEIMGEAGIESDTALRALYPLILGTLTNIRLHGPVRALTGPVSRGDIQSVKIHINDLLDRVPEFLPLYRLLGRFTLDLALEKGTINASEAEDFKREFGGS